jgi:excinuclease UvrABC nuclease subunit
VVVPDEVDEWEMLRYLEEEMLREAESLNFERAASIRDRIEEMRWNLSRRHSSGKSR